MARALGVQKRGQCCAAVIGRKREVDSSIDGDAGTSRRSLDLMLMVCGAVDIGGTEEFAGTAVGSAVGGERIDFVDGEDV